MEKVRDLLEKVKPILRYMKRCDAYNRITIPKTLTDKFGRDFYLEVFDDCMIIVPIFNKEEK